MSEDNTEQQTPKNILLTEFFNSMPAMLLTSVDKYGANATEEDLRRLVLASFTCMASAIMRTNNEEELNAVIKELDGLIATDMEKMRKSIKTPSIILTP